MSEMSIGKKIQSIRMGLGLSVRKAAAMAEITPSMLSQIENDQVNPSINTLRSIADSLETPLYMFFQEEPKETPVVRPQDRLTIGSKSEPDIRYELLTPDTKGNIEFCMMIIPAGMSSYRDAHSHIGEEVAFMRRGRRSFWRPAARHWSCIRETASAFRPKPPTSGTTGPRPLSR